MTRFNPSPPWALFESGILFRDRLMQWEIDYFNSPQWRTQIRIPVTVPGDLDTTQRISVVRTMTRSSAP